MIEVDQDPVAVADRGVDVLLDRGPRPDPDLGGLDPPAPSQPAKRSKKWTPCSTKIPPLFPRSQNQCPSGRFSSEA